MHPVGNILHPELSVAVVAAFHQVYNELGHGFPESVYELAMAHVLEEMGFTAARQHPVAVQFRARIAGEFRADLLVGRTVVLELKCCRRFDPAHEAQLPNLLRASDLELGFLVNVGPKPEFRRFLYTNDRKILLRDRWEEEYEP